MYFILLALTSSLFLIADVDCQSGVILRFFANNDGGMSRIEEGERVTFACQVNSDFNEGTDTLRIGKLSSDGIFTELGSLTDARDSTNSATWLNSFFQIFIVGISKYDSGNYQCSAGRPSDSSSSVSIGYRTYTVDVLYPSSGFPVCETSPRPTINSDSILYSGDEITLQCSSDVGNPAVTLEWRNNKNVEITDTQMEVLSNRTILNTTVILYSVNSGVIFLCLRTNPEFPSNQAHCTIGPLTLQERPETTPVMPTLASVTTSTISNIITKPSAAVVGVEVIATIVGVVVIIIVIIIIILFIVKSGRCASILKCNKDDSRTEKISLEAGHNNGKVAIQDHSHDNPAVDANHVLSPNGGQLYAVVQKNTPARESSASGDISKVYPVAPEYPRPEKTRQSDGDLYANAGIVRDEASGESPDNPSNNSAARKEDTAGISSEKSNDGDASGMTLYANPSDIATKDSADASLIGTTRKQEDPEMALYANASEVIPDNSHMPAPSEAPPAPPAMAHTPGLEYADIDIARPASLGADGRVDIISNEDQVLYASVN